MTNTTSNPKYKTLPIQYVIRNGEVTSTIKSRRIVSNDGESCIDIIRNNLYGTPSIVYCYNRFVDGYGHLQGSGFTIDEAIKSWREKYARIAS